MSEPKPFASLSSSLLARKGGAKPAMRPHGFGPGSSEDLGWNDHGGDGPAAPRRTVVLAPTPAVRRQQAELAREFAANAAAESAVAAASPAPIRLPRGARAKAAFTLRLDPERHLRLRLACAVKHRSAQEIVTEALDQLLAQLPEIEDLAAQLPSPGSAGDKLRG